MNKRKILAALAVGVSAMCTFAAPRTTLLDIKDSISDDNIEFPYSFQADTHKMLRNWYIENYAALDNDVEVKTTGDVSEETYIKRLAAMPVEIEMPYNGVVRSYIDMYVQRRRTLVELMLGLGTYYMPIFEAALDKEGIPLELKYLPIVESALDPDAVSPVGATGLWQFMVGTGKDLGLEINSLVDERRDPYKSSAAAAKYLKQLYKIYGDWSLVIASYNCGPGNVNKALQRAAIEDGKGQEFWAIYNYLPRETRGYVPAFIAVNYVMTYYRHHNISPALAKKPVLIDTVAVRDYINLNQVEAVLGVPLEALKVLNPQYRKDIIPGNNHPYMLALPAQQVYSYMLSRDSIANYRKDLYAQRKVAEPASLSGDDDMSQEYTYETRTETVYHKVGRRENISSIAKKYGVTTASIRQSNGLGRKAKVTRGQNLKIVTTKRVKVAKPAENSGGEALAQQNEIVALDAQAQAQEQESIANAAKNKAASEAKSRAATASKSKSADDSEYSHLQDLSVEDMPIVRKSPTPKTTTKPSTTSKKASEGIVVKHTVKKGESLSSIAEENGVTVEDLKAANNITDDNIMAGESLTIPSSGSHAAAQTTNKASAETRATKPVTYTVKSGDTLDKIAKRNGTTVAELKRLNNIKGDALQIGQTIVTKQAPATKAKSKKKSKKKRR